MIPQAIDDIGQRLTAIADALAAALPARTVSRDYKHFLEQSEADLTAGVVSMLLSTEGDFKNGVGMVAKEGTLHLVLIGQLRVDEGTSRQDLEAAEVALATDIKGFARGTIQGMSLALREVHFSRQQEHPYGWIVAYLDAGPPLATTH